MRGLILAAMACVAFANLAAAQDYSPENSPIDTTPHISSCRTEAKIKANAFVQDYLVPAKAEDTAVPEAYVAIVYGQKFLAPLHGPGNGDIEQHGLGEVLAKRNHVYREELNRCLGLVRVKLNLKLNQAIYFD